MGGERDQVRAPWVMEGPEDTLRGQVSRPDNDNVLLGFLPDVVNIGTSEIGHERTVDVVRPVLLNGDGALVTSLTGVDRTTTTPSAFRDKLGLDPDDTIDREAFELLSPPTIPISTLGPKGDCNTTSLQADAVWQARRGPDLEGGWRRWLV